MSTHRFFQILSTGILVCFFSNCSPSKTSLPEEDINVTLEEGTNMSLALSPDRQTLAIGLQGTICTLPVGGGETTPLTDPLWDCQEPSWSPDGEKLAFHSYVDQNYHIYTIHKDGSDLQQITEGPYDDREPAWSPDGNTLVFSSDRNGNYDIWEVKLDNKQARALTTHSANEYNPVFSPSREHVAFISENPEYPGIYRMNPQGEDIQLIVPSTGRLAAPSWNPSGEKIAFVRFENGRSQLLIWSSDKQVPTESIPQVEDVFPFRAAWQNDHSFLFTADGRINRYDPNEPKLTHIPFQATVTLHRPSYPRKRYNFDDMTRRKPLGIMGPVVSPDGKSVVFTALGDIWIHNMETGSTSPLTDDPYVDIDPAWSPDGQQIAFVSDRQGRMDLWIKDLPNGTLKQMTDEDQIAGFPVWSPDGSQIALFLRNTRNVWGHGTLQIIETSTQKTIRFEGSYFVPGKPSWAPDGQGLVFSALKPASSRYREGVSALLFISVKDGTKRYIDPPDNRTPAIRNTNGPVWSPDGKYLAYIQDGLLWRLPVDTEGNPSDPPEKLTEHLASSPSWTADSRSLVYLATDHLERLELETGESIEIAIDLSWKPEISQDKYVVHAGRLFDGLRNTYWENVDLVVHGNRIKEIVPHREDRSLPVIDASDKTIIPGLFEMHSHAHNSVGEKLGRTWLAYGITSVREPGTDPYDALERKEAWASGQRPGPREFFTGGLTDGSRIYYGLANSVITDAHLELELDRAQRLGYDLIKTYVRMPDPMQKRIIEAAHEMGIPMSSHEIYPAAKYNADATEHTSGTSRRGYSPKQTFMGKTYEDVVQLLVHSQMNVTPTIGLQGGFFVLVDRDPSILQNRQYLALYPESFQAAISERVKSTLVGRLGYIQNVKNKQAAVTRIVEAGGRITAGTDVPFLPFGHSLHVEMQLYEDGGLSSFQVLQSATIRAAEAVGVSEDLGSLEPGKLADFVIVDGDPLAKVRDAWNVVMTIKGGIRYDVEALLEKP